MKTTLAPLSAFTSLPFVLCLMLAGAPARAGDQTGTQAPFDKDGNISGKIVDSIDTAGYTYVQVDTGGQLVWAATTDFAVSKGDSVTVFGAMPMSNFHSKSLNRSFDVIYFTGRIVDHTKGDSDSAPVLPPGHPAIGGQKASPSLPPNHPAITGQPGPVALASVSGIKRVEGGNTVQEVISRSAQLAGKPVKIRGKITKYNGMVMGRNWIHIEDGSGSLEGRDYDLTVTTAVPAKLGDTVVVSGTVTVDRDFGSGYRYPVIIENASVTIE